MSNPQPFSATINTRQTTNVFADTPIPGSLPEIQSPSKIRPFSESINKLKGEQQFEVYAGDAENLPEQVGKMKRTEALKRIEELEAEGKLLKKDSLKKIGNLIEKWKLEDALKGRVPSYFTPPLKGNIAVTKNLITRLKVSVDDIYAACNKEEKNLDAGKDRLKGLTDIEIKIIEALGP